MTPVPNAMSVRTCPFVPVRIAVAAAVALLACKPEPETEPPTPADPQTVADPPPVASAGDPPPVVAADPPVDAGPPVEPPPADPVTAPPGDVTAPPAPTSSTPAPAGKEPLPAALNTKINASCGKDPGVGTQAKPFDLKTPDGKAISLASFRGKVVLLNFWGTWCKPCLKELPEFDRLYRRYRKHGLVVVAVATDTEPEKVKEFAAQAKLATRLALGGEPLSQEYDSPQFPFSFIIDAKGMIQASYRGYRPECAGKLEQDLRSQLELLR
jgi:peroxiredoxin